MFFHQREHICSHLPVRVVVNHHLCGKYDQKTCRRDEVNSPRKQRWVANIMVGTDGVSLSLSVCDSLPLYNWRNRLIIKLFECLFPVFLWFIYFLPSSAVSCTSLSFFGLISSSLNQSLLPPLSPPFLSSWLSVASDSPLIQRLKEYSCFSSYLSHSVFTCCIGLGDGRQLQQMQPCIVGYWLRAVSGSVTLSSRVVFFFSHPSLLF